MNQEGPLSTPFDKAWPTPSASGGTVTGNDSGVQLADAPQATANMSELPACPTIYAKDIPGAPAIGEHIDVDDKVTAPGIPFTQFGKG